MGGRRRKAILLAGALVAGTLPLAGPAVAATPPEADPGTIVEVELPLSTVRGVEAGAGEVYVSGDDELLVYDLDGELLDVVEELPGAGPMALDPDGEVLFVGLTAVDEVVALDLDDLDELATFEVESEPQSLLATGSHLHVGTGVTARHGNLPHLETFDLDDADGDVTERMSGTPLLDSDGDELFVAQASLSPATLEVRSLDGEPYDPPVATSFLTVLHDLAYDGSTDLLWAALRMSNAPDLRLQAVDPGTLATVAGVRVPTQPTAVTGLWTGAHVAAGPHDAWHDLAIWEAVPDTPARLRGRLDLPGSLVPRGLSTADDGTLAAISQDPAGGWLTLLDTPELGIPELAVVGPGGVVHEPVDAGAVLRAADGSPLPGVDVTVTSPAGTTATRTDTEGRFRLTHPPVATASTLRFAVEVAAGAGHRPASVEAEVAVARRPVTITDVSAPSVRVGEPLVVTGSATDPAGHPVELDVRLLTAGAPAVTLPVIADGAFRVEVPTEGTGAHLVEVAAAQRGVHSATTRTVATEVARWTTTLILDGAALVAGTSSPIGGRLVDAAGQPVSSADVTVTVSGETWTEQTARTDAGGRFAVSHTEPRDGTVTVLAGYAGDARNLPSSARTDRRVDRAPRQLVLELPTSAPALSPLTVGGQLRDPLGHGVGGRAVTVDIAGPTTRIQTAVTTAPDGRFTYRFTPQVAERLTVTVTAAGDVASADAATARTVTVVRAVPRLGLDALTSPVDHGSAVTLTARMPAPAGATVRFVAVDLATGSVRRLGDVALQRGVASLTTTARAHTRYEVRFARTAAYEAATAARTVRVRAVVDAPGVRGHDRTVSGEPSFPRGARPTIASRVRAAQPTTTTTVTLQRWNGSAWVAAQSWRAATGDDGRLSTRVPKGLGAGRYRVRVTAPETPANLAGASAWRPLRVR